MDEDHSRFRTQPRSTLSSRHNPRSPASPPSSILPGGAASDPFSGEGGWSTADPRVRRPSFVDARPHASAGGGGGCPAGDKGSANAAGAAAGVGVVGGPVEMVCVDVADLADVLAVRQEELAPEQVTVYFCEVVMVLEVVRGVGVVGWW